MGKILFLRSAVKLCQFNRHIRKYYQKVQAFIICRIKFDRFAFYSFETRKSEYVLIYNEYKYL